MNVDSETFVAHMAIREQKEMAIDPDSKVQIETQSRVQSGAQIQDKT